MPHPYRDESLFADQDEIAQRQLRRSRERHRQRLLIAIGLAVVSGLGALFSQHGPAIPAFTFHFPWMQPGQASAPVNGGALTTGSADILAERLTSVVIGDEPQPRARPRELNDCLGDDNLIDERVITCRFGELPRGQAAGAPTGMLSERYLAQYRAERVAQREQTSQRALAVENESVWIPGWDGGNRYLAQWQAVDNRIVGSSVCANHRVGSIDYRECRKAAKVHFRAECQRWEGRSDPYADKQRERYCHAASAFSPM